MRLLSAAVELAAATAMWKLGRLEAAVQINAALGLFGPTILALVTFIGIAGLAGKLSPLKFALIAAGVILILIGARR